MAYCNGLFSDEREKKKVTFEVFITGTKLRHNHIPAGQCRIKSQKRLTEDSKSGLSLICYFCFFQINRESWCSLEPCPDSSLLERKRTRESPGKLCVLGQHAGRRAALWLSLLAFLVFTAFFFFFFILASAGKNT